MRIIKLELKNFRNIETCRLKFDRNINIVYGNNAQGKTNFLESIYYSAFARSFRTIRDYEMISNGADFTKINLDLFSFGREQRIEIIINSSDKKSIKLNGVAIKKIPELIGKLNVVSFVPEDLSLVKGMPGERRRFLNREISQLYPQHVNELIDYNKLIQQRNKAIKQHKFLGKSADLICIWDEQLAELGARIIERRRIFIDKLNEIALTIHRDISSTDERLELKYNNTILSQKSVKNGKMIDGLLMELKDNLDVDIKYGHTTKGPSKDDMDVFIDGFSAKLFASQGQKRTAALAVKLAEIELINRLIGEKPIVILDDVFSELDENRRRSLINYIKDCHCFISTTDLDKYENESNIDRLFVDNGVIVKV